MNRELLLRALSFLTTLGLVVAGWFLKDTYQSMESMKTDITLLQIQTANLEKTALSNSSFIESKELINAKIALNDKRVSIVENNFNNLLTILNEVKRDVKDIKDRQ
ncbi:hypothetical protein N9955_00080 [bacterium]|nr:hypothetical protein [bacterium]